LKTKNINGKIVVKPEKELATMASNYETVKRYYDNNCTEFKIRQVKADAQIVKEYAAEHGCSVQALFLAAVHDYMEQGKTPDEVKRGRKKKNVKEE
jgi:hypothetical protein